MIFTNPRGAPELACDHCGCRWVDRIKGTCYECGAPVSAEAQLEFSQALAAFGIARQQALENGRDTSVHGRANEPMER